MILINIIECLADLLVIGATRANNHVKHGIDECINLRTLGEHINPLTHSILVTHCIGVYFDNNVDPRQTYPIGYTSFSYA